MVLTDCMVSMVLVTVDRSVLSPEQELSRLMREVVSRLDTLLELGRTRSAPRRSAKPRKSRPAVVVDEFTMARARRRLEEMGLGGDDGST